MRQAGTLREGLAGIAKGHLRENTSGKASGEGKTKGKGGGKGSGKVNNVLRGTV